MFFGGKRAKIITQLNQTSNIHLEHACGKIYPYIENEINIQQQQQPLIIIQ